MTSNKKNTFIKNFHYSSIGLNLNSRIVLCGHDYAKKDNYFWHGLKRGEKELILWQHTLSGCGLINYEGKKMIIDQGQSLLLKIPHDHYYEVFPASDHWEVDFIMFRGTECLRLGETLIKNFGPSATMYSDQEILSLADKILDNSIQYSAGEASTLAYQFMITLVEKCSLNNENIPEIFLASKQYILENYTENHLQVATLAEFANMSYPYFVRQFSSLFNISPGAYIMQLRMELAVNLLQSTQYSISEIAESCGFSSSSYFCRAFNRIYALSPTQFRNSLFNNY